MSLTISCVRETLSQGLAFWPLKEKQTRITHPSTFGNPGPQEMEGNWRSDSGKNAWVQRVSYKSNETLEGCVQRKKAADSQPPASSALIKQGCCPPKNPLRTPGCLSSESSVHSDCPPLHVYPQATTGDNCNIAYTFQSESQSALWLSVG
ncbi:hypothetical protein TESG_03224 [Trichophyton tonsurans CBS 112818]|uniref:Uncharacterized protein n=1 Tax=Trichophyton tonsurans (strain CBS 112818) TaxID=647933 RepID=F2RWQ8_TRIT1|nr:hypothetical protein TESG_03224 [Trichophyton tonsurans CBS 112818]